jgi:hypothetical protein
MKRLALFLAACALAILTACASAPSVNGQLKAAYDTTNAYVEITSTSLQRGRITADQAARASANAKKAMNAIDTAAFALAGCKPPSPCTDYLALMQSLQPTLLEFERELRSQQGVKP